MSEWDPDEPQPTDQAAPYQPEMPSGVRLVVTAGPDRGRQLALTEGRHVVGKAPDCALVLTDGRVSRHHLALEVSEAGVTVRDLGSRNGSYYAGARFSEVTVGAGAVLTIGASELRVVGPPAAPALPPSTASRFGRLRGGSRRMREVYALLERLAPTDAVVLIEGETGTGKELCAEAIHQASPRAGRPFVICDLAGMSRSLIESELFGHVRGAFTGADRDHKGLFQQAHGGTIFLDEIGELELSVQPRLLRTLEQRRVRPVGDTGYRDVDVRVVAATNRDLREEVKAGRFREDLYHRLAVMRVKLPPLRERKEDIPVLVEAVLAATEPVHLPQETISLLCEYDWPGNVRELRNVVERARLLAPVENGRRVLRPELLGFEPSGAPAGDSLAAWGPVGSEGYREAKERLLAAWERQFVTQLLQRTGGNVKRAAREGGIDRGYLYRLMKKLGID